MTHFIDKIRERFIDKYDRDILWLAVIGLLLLSWAIEATR